MQDRRRVILAAVVLASFDASFAKAQGGRVLPDSTVRAIDALFAPYAHSGSPGCAVGVYQNGAVTFARGYGFADLNHDVPITAATRFTVGSVSKQFTAASIALLAQSGRISLDDDVRKYVPEIPAYQAPVTIRHLVHHTSGVRDFWELVTLAGWRPDDGYTADDMLNLAAHQKGLNFTPGAEYRYSNTGYLLLGLVVRRVTGQSLRAFADSAIFRPLGMRETLFLDDHTEIVPRRAPAYAPAGAGFHIDVWNNDIVGQGGIVTSIADLQKWDENFYDARVGGKSLIAQLQTPGTITGSGPMTYAFGLSIETYRGMQLVQHTGSTGGYRAALYRFPDAHTSVAMLCNVSTANTGQLALRMSDAVLGGRFGAPPERVAGAGRAGGRGAGAAVGTPRAASQRDAALGRYRSDELLGAVWDVTAGDATDGIAVQRARSARELFTADENLLSFSSRGTTLLFDPPARGKSPGFVVRGNRVSGLRFERVVP
jgi:CubicO group peptidase (beta-lactamase class C family)